MDVTVEFRTFFLSTDAVFTTGVIKLETGRHTDTCVPVHIVGEPFTARHMVLTVVLTVNSILLVCRVKNCNKKVQGAQDIQGIKVNTGFGGQNRKSLLGS